MIPLREKFLALFIKEESHSHLFSKKRRDLPDYMTSASLNLEGERPVSAKQIDPPVIRHKRADSPQHLS